VTNRDGIEDEILEAEAPIGVEEGSEPVTESHATEQGTRASDSDLSADGAPDLRLDGSGQADSDEESTLREEHDRLNDRHLRLVAEFNNFRRRSEQERLSAWSRAQADMVGKFVEVLDDLHRVADLDLSNATVEAIMEGIDLVERKFVSVLGDSNVDVIDPTGEPFDPELMEAMMRVPAEADEQVDQVAQVFQKGYSLKGILVRPARVSVYTQG
jgi:molecular chaperone GrpE